MGSSQSTQEQFVYPIESDREVHNRINAMFGASQPQQRQAKDTLHFSQFEIQRGGKRKRNRYAALENQLQRAMAGGGDSPCEQCSADVARKVAELINQVKLPVTPVASELLGMDEEKKEKVAPLSPEMPKQQITEVTSPLGTETAAVPVGQLSVTSDAPKIEQPVGTLSITSPLQSGPLLPLSETSSQEVKPNEPIETQKQYSATSMTPQTGGSKKKKNDSDDENDDSDDDTDSISDTSSDDDEHTTQTGGSEINIMQFFSSDGSEYYNNMQKRNRFT